MYMDFRFEVHCVNFRKSQRFAAYWTHTLASSNLVIFFLLFSQLRHFTSTRPVQTTDCFASRIPIEFNFASSIGRLIYIWPAKAIYIHPASSNQ
ncbi:hypothetical protein METBIDRAFT_31443 [Metschnikowia bicuspidata var. bicuspidata NRRL YB-4993]|uniref:Uncharacterized protein n=1 Tax=Metschnikowia bicuspidata var. bicuspidata NRRL YB-4993 TaxID=869754 RepID=A0A1A0HF93_9ASCO|nr:hypothetical protein METBIDRAFT_31443 [Metschnikowia bicuspidata var. bicuspidata NRRL YB-4993]OBA22562.1 hypothetical protein METBIDRAFT_31443 [Metschnikowia bicuspidata var. bicuspidata NRRL YB-4993]